MDWFHSYKLLCLLVIISFQCHPIIAGDLNEYHNGHLRYKRFALFPEGSAFSATISSSFNINDIVSEGFQLNTDYDLPMNESLLFTMSSSSARAILMRKRRSELYTNLELIMSLNGFNGQMCVYRTLCEAAKKLAKKHTLIDALLTTIFHFPHENITESEPHIHHMYKFARDTGVEGQNCAKIYDSCPFSLMDFHLDVFS